MKALAEANRGRLFVLVFFVFGLPEWAKPTATVAIRTNNEIILAADSEVTDTQGNEVGSTCKVRQLASNLFFTIMGISTNKESGFDAFSIVEKSSLAQGDLQQQIDAIESALTPPLEGALTLIKKEAPKTFQEIAVDHAPVTLTLAAIERSGLVLYGRTFRVLNIAKNGDVSVMVERRVCPGTDCPNGVVRVMGSPLGAPDSDRFERLYPDWENHDVMQVARQFMAMVKDEPGVKAPFSFLQVTSKGAKWLGEHEGCKEIW